jgi:hypothetical protein
VSGYGAKRRGRYGLRAWQRWLLSPHGVLAVCCKYPSPLLQRSIANMKRCTANYLFPRLRIQAGINSKMTAKYWERETCPTGILAPEGASVLFK